MIFMLRLENSLLCKQNGITSQIVYVILEGVSKSEIKLR